MIISVVVRAQRAMPTAAAFHPHVRKSSHPKASATAICPRVPNHTNLDGQSVGMMIVEKRIMSATGYHDVRRASIASFGSENTFLILKDVSIYEGASPPIGNVVDRGNCTAKMTLMSIAADNASIAFLGSLFNCMYLYYHMFMSTFLVTGGAGFIGSNIVRHLVSRGEKVVVLDDLSHGNKENIEDVKDKITFIEGDIRNLDVVKKSMKGVDYVLHHAALHAVPQSIEYPLEVNDVNTNGTLQVLVAARDAGVKRVVFASSSSVYGDTGAKQNTEDMVPAPMSPYAVSKLAGEHYCKVFSSLYGLDTVILRYFNVFGPSQDPKSQYAAVVPVLMSNLVRGEVSEIHGDGEQSRNFTYVENVIQGNMDAVHKEGKLNGEVFNIAADKSITVKELYRALQDVLGTDIDPKYIARRAGDIGTNYADISKAKSVLGYTPLVAFEDGLTKVVEWYRKSVV